MKYIFYIVILLLSLNATEVKNTLANETSPYLQQHASNPIKWMPWGEEAFERAKKENKAIFLSIGYSTCHWCHVMAKEAFENEEVAEVFNRYFISVKVDREEMPHLDSYYQRVHQRLKNRSGGWPLSAFLTHDKKPFYVATYIPLTKEHYHEGLDTLLPRIGKMYQRDFASVTKEVKKIESLMRNPSKKVPSKSANISVKTLSDSILKSYDSIYSGFGRQKKFPEASRVQLMMDLALLSKSKELEKNALNMLDVMALRGLYDHVGGGFFRYTVDAAWEIPHFEKMLYNQAELIPLYTRAYHSTKKKLYRDVVDETIAMIERRFVKNDLFYSASDADTHHVEGHSFIYTPKETRDALKNNKHEKEIEESLEFSILGNFETMVHLNFYTQDRPKGFEEFKKELLKIREKKEYPFIDKKINTAWNAMMIEALYKASSIDKNYAKKADRHLEALLTFMFNNGEVYHQSLLGIKPTQLGLLEDYSFLISALISAYETTYNEERLALAEYLLNRAKSKFYRDGVWYLSDDELGIEADLKDKYYTSPLSKMLQNIIKIASLKASFRYEKLALKSLETVNAQLQIKQSSTPAASIAFLMQELEVVTLKNRESALLKDKQKIQKIQHPFIVTKSHESDNYLACTMRSCFSVDKSLKNVKISIEKRIEQ